MRPSANKVLHSDAGDFTTNGIEARNRYALRSVIDDEVRARNLLKRANIATLAADNATLQIIGRNVNVDNGDLSRVVGSATR